MYVQRCGKLTVSCEYTVCVCVWRGFTEARNRDLVFIAFRMMTLPAPRPLSISPYFRHLPGRGEQQKTGWANLTGGSGGGNEQEDREEMRKAGGGRDTLASYPECHSSWQCQPALPLAVGPQPLPAFSGIYVSLWWCTDLGLFANLGPLNFLQAEQACVCNSQKVCNKKWMAK